MKIKKINFSPFCTGEHSKWSASVQLLETFRLWCNTQRAEMTAQEAKAWNLSIFRPMNIAIQKEINEAKFIMRDSNHWNPKIPDHVSDGVIHYPSGLNLSNEGSRAVFLHGLLYKLHGEKRIINHPDTLVVEKALQTAIEDAIGNSPWNLTIEDIVDAN